MATKSHSNSKIRVDSGIVATSEILAKTIAESTEEELTQLNYILHLALKNIEDRREQLHQFQAKE